MFFFRVAFFLAFLASSARAEEFEHRWLMRIKPPPYSGLATTFSDPVGAWGNRLDHSQRICAHVLEARGTKLRVTNVENGKTTVCEVQDIGPNRKFWPRREIDLSAAADRDIGCAGMCSVTIERE